MKILSQLVNGTAEERDEAMVSLLGPILFIMLIVVVCLGLGLLVNLIALLLFAIILLSLFIKAIISVNDSTIDRAIQRINQINEKCHELEDQNDDLLQRLEQARNTVRRYYRENQDISQELSGLNLANEHMAGCIIILKEAYDALRQQDNSEDDQVIFEHNSNGVFRSKLAQI